MYTVHCTLKSIKYKWKCKFYTFFKNESESIGLKITRAYNKRTELEARHWKYVDDLTVAEAIKLKAVLTNDDEEQLEVPLTYHNRTNEILPPEKSLVQKQLSEISKLLSHKERFLLITLNLYKYCWIFWTTIHFF